jgi:hypothetical protein
VDKKGGPHPTAPPRTHRNIASCDFNAVELHIGGEGSLAPTPSDSLIDSGYFLADVFHVRLDSFGSSSSSHTCCTAFFPVVAIVGLDYLNRIAYWRSLSIAYCTDSFVQDGEP